MYDKEYLASDADILPDAPKQVMATEPENDEGGMLWEENHKKIIDTIKEMMSGSRPTPPGVTDIARKTGLSRTTIYNHMREFKYNTTQQERYKMFELMKFDVMMRLCHNAIGGDFKAMKLYLKLMENEKKF